MTVSSAVNKIAYTANGTSKDFTVPFYFIYKSDLKVYRMNENVQELLTLDTDYTVIGTPELPDGSIYKNGGTVVMTATPAAGTQFIILREVPLTQEADYQEGSTFPAALHELALDKLTMAIQQLEEKTDRSVMVDIFSDTDPSSLVSEIETLYDVKDEVITAAENIGSIVTAAQDINAIKDAPNQANSARNSAISAQNSAVTAQLMAAQAGESVSAAAASASAAETSAASSESSAQTAHDYALQAVRNNIGDFFYTSRLDTELNGAVECNGATYSVSAFTEAQSVPALLAAGKLPYVGIAIFDSLVAANGSCRAWGWDGADATVFKVPKLNDVYLMAGIAASVGEFVSESLPNIKGSFTADPYPQPSTETGCFSRELLNGTYRSTGTANANIYGLVKFDASESAPAYQDGARVRPDSVRYRAMVQIATGVKEDATHLKEYKFNNPNFFGQSMYSDVSPDNASWLISGGQYNARTVYPDYYDWLSIKLNGGACGYKQPKGYSYIDTGDTGYFWWISTTNPVVGMSVYRYDESKRFHVDGVITSVSGSNFTFYSNTDSTSYTVTRNTSTDTDSLVYRGYWITDYDFVVNTADQTFRLPLLNRAENIPSWEHAEVISSNIPFTAPRDGWIYGAGTYQGDAKYFLNEISVGVSRGTAAWASSGTVAVRVKKGDVFNSAASFGSYGLTFIPAVGNGSLYYYVGDTLQDVNLINAGAALNDIAELKNASNFSSIGKSVISGLGMPSKRYIDLTLGASEAIYTAPANGWFNLITQGLTYLDMYRTNDRFGSISNPNNGYARKFVPIQKGQSLTIYYAGTPTNTSFRFYYAEGTNNV